MQVDRAAFRNAMACFGSAVSVISTDGPGGRRAFTCTAMCPVTDEPATVLVCVHRDSQCNQAFKMNLAFCVNLLSTDQSDVSAVFAGRMDVKMDDRFRKVGWRTLETGSPVFDDAVAVLDCKIVELKECGTHTILFGQVLAASSNPGREPLMYHKRAYQRLVTPQQNRLDGRSTVGSFAS